MTDLESWLAAELAPADHAPDDAFIATTMACIAAAEVASAEAVRAEQRAFAATRHRLLAEALAQLTALAALVAGLVALSDIPALATFRITPGLVAPPLLLVLALWAWATGLFDPIGDIAGRTA